MRYAICNETFTDWTWDATLECAARLGYTGLEVAPFTIGEHAGQVEPQKRRDLANAARRAGVPVIGLHWLLVSPKGLYVTTPDDAIRRRTADYFVDLVRLCADLGGTFLVIGSPKQRNLLPGITRERALGYAEEVYGRALPEAERCGVTLAIEPLSPVDTDFLRTGDDGIELIKRLNHPRFRLHLDVKAMSGSETDPIPDVIRRSAPYLHHFHANDPNLLGPGMGAVDHRPIMKALKEAGYKGWLSVEVFNYAPGPEYIARQSIDYLRRVDAMTE